MDVVEKNIARMADYFKSRKCKLRPHIKTHKLPLIAVKQINAGAIGITCAKLGEAEVFIKSGIKNILIANEIVGEIKIRRLINLSRYSNIIICMDSYENAMEISKIAKEEKTNIEFLVEVNVGLNRCGVLPGEPALILVKKISELDNLVFKGLMGYEGGVFINDINNYNKGE